MRHVGLQSVRGSIQTKSPRRQYIFPRFLKNFGFSSEKPQLHTPLCTGGFSHRSWWSQAGSNRRPPACKAGALPAELWPLCEPFFAWRRSLLTHLKSCGEVVGLGRVELPTSPLSGVRSNQLSYRPEASAAGVHHPKRFESFFSALLQ